MNKPNFKPKMKNPIKRRKGEEERVTEAFANVPRITNDTVAEHREEVLAGARKFIYPLQHSKYSVIRISAVLLAVVVIAFFSYVGLSLYKFQSTSNFVYDVTRVLPLPVAKAGDRWVSYESYLFELRRNMHYYRTQQGADFAKEDGKVQLQRLKDQAMTSVIKAAYVKEVAEEKGIEVTNREVQDQVALVRSQNRLGSSDRVFKDVLNEFWGWSVADFERALRQQLLQQKVASTLDEDSKKRANDALAQVKGGADFAALATAQSEDPVTKANGGQYPEPITKSNNAIPPKLTAALFSLKEGEVSGVVDTGYTREIVKAIKVGDNTVTASHIQFNVKDIDNYINPVAKENPPMRFIKF